MPAVKLKPVETGEMDRLWPADEVERRPIETLIPYARNARTHSPAQISQLAGSMAEFGWTMPILVDEAGGIIAGHGRIMAAHLLVNSGRQEFATARVMVARGWSDSQKRAYILADNQLALNADWDTDLLKLELDDLGEMGVDLASLGFTDEVLDELDLFSDGGGEDETYSRKIEAPIYEPTGENPPIGALTDDAKTRELKNEIRAAELPADIQDFLETAADRHTIFNFAKIAEFYAHADPPVQRLMERSALVIIDFEAAIENGFVKLTKRFGEMAAEADDAAG